MLQPTHSFGGDTIDSPRVKKKVQYEEEVEAADELGDLPEKPPEKKMKKQRKKLGIEATQSKADLARAEFSDQELAAFEKAFSTFDADGNGTLEVSEIERVLKQLDKPMSRDEILDLLYDVDLADTINKDEFIQMMAGAQKFRTRSLSQDERRMVKRIFMTFDYEKRGYWTFEEFESYFQAIDVEAVLEFSEENFQKVNGLLGSKDKSKLEIEQLELFYTIEDRTMSTDLESDYRRCCE